MLIRLLYESGFIHQGLIQNNSMTDAIVDHLDFKQKYVVKKYPFAFNPYAENNDMAKGFGKRGEETGKAPAIGATEEELEKILPQLLQECEVKIRVLINDDKKSLNDDIKDIKKDTGIAAGAVSAEASTKRLDELIAAAEAILQLDGAISQFNTRKSLTGGNLRTQK